MKRLLPNTFFNNSSSSGFTLIELMVAITIVAIMSVAGIIVYTQVQQNARDSKRREDINAIATAIEGAKDPTSSTYSSISASNFPTQTIPFDPAGTATTTRYCIAVAAAGTNTVPAIPTAWATRTTCPTNYAAFTGTNVNGFSAWTLCALLEKGTNPANIICLSNSQ